MTFYDIWPLCMIFYDKISKSQFFMTLHDFMTELKACKSKNTEKHFLRPMLVHTNYKTTNELKSLKFLPLRGTVNLKTESGLVLVNYLLPSESQKSLFIRVITKASSTLFAHTKSFMIGISHLANRRKLSTLSQLLQHPLLLSPIT